MKVNPKKHLDFLENGAIAIAVQDDGASKASAAWGALEKLLLLILSSWNLSAGNPDAALAAGQVTRASSLAWDNAGTGEDLEKVLVILELESLLGTRLGNAGD